jgi:hypothetical protein
MCFGEKSVAPPSLMGPSVKLSSDKLPCSRGLVIASRTPFLGSNLFFWFVGPTTKENTILPSRASRWLKRCCVSSPREPLDTSIWIAS